jgi:hypothetical protein
LEPFNDDTHIILASTHDRPDTQLRLHELEERLYEVRKKEMGKGGNEEEKEVESGDRNKSFVLESAAIGDAKRTAAELQRLNVCIGREHDGRCLATCEREG